MGARINNFFNKRKLEFQKPFQDFRASNETRDVPDRFDRSNRFDACNCGKY